MNSAPRRLPRSHPRGFASGRGAAESAPDYAFRIGETRKFFAEAKKPGVDLKTDAGPAYQLRRYAWSAKLPFSLLTDFEELAVYDCRSPLRETTRPVSDASYFTPSRNTLTAGARSGTCFRGGGWAARLTSSSEPAREARHRRSRRRVPERDRRLARCAGAQYGAAQPAA